MKKKIDCLFKDNLRNANVIIAIFFFSFFILELSRKLLAKKKKKERTKEKNHDKHEDILIFIEHFKTDLDM